MAIQEDSMYTDSVVQTEEQLIENNRDIINNVTKHQLSGLYQIGVNFNLYYKDGNGRSSYGDRTVEKHAMAIGISVSKLRKCTVFADKFTRDQVDILIKGNGLFPITWRFIYNNLSKSADEIIRLYMEAESPEQFSHGVRECEANGPAIVQSEDDENSQELGMGDEEVSGPNGVVDTKKIIDTLLGQFLDVEGQVSITSEAPDPKDLIGDEATQGNRQESIAATAQTAAQHPIELDGSPNPDRNFPENTKEESGGTDKKDDQFVHPSMTKSPGVSPAINKGAKTSNPGIENPFLKNISRPSQSNNSGDGKKPVQTPNPPFTFPPKQVNEAETQELDDGGADIGNYIRDPRPTTIEEFINWTEELLMAISMLQAENKKLKAENSKLKGK